MTTHNMTCCVCGNGAGRWQQHWNQDTGYGICPVCVAEQAAKITPEELQELYGHPDVNYRKPTTVRNGLRYHVIALTYNQDNANAFMARTPGASVLFVEPVDGGIFIVHKDDFGAPT